MDDFGLITIDNKNLLNDLLELDGKHDFDDQYDLLYSNNNNNNQTQYLSNKFQSNYIQPKSQQLSSQQQQQQARKFYLESPTFAKGEDDIYRFVHSRISVLDQDHEEDLNDSLDNDNNSNNYKESIKKNISNQNLNNNNITIQRIGSNKLLSDLAVASLSSKLQNNNSFKPIENQININSLADSLDEKTTINKNKDISNNNQYLKDNHQLFNSNHSSNNINNNNNNNNNYNNIQQQQQQQQQQQPFLINQSPSQQQSFLQYPTNIQPLFVLPSPTSSFQYQQPQFIPIPLGSQIPSQAPANMYYSEPLQPMFYNTAYPLNTYPPVNNYYNNHQQNDYSNDPYQQYQQQKPDLYNQQQQINRSILQQQQIRQSGTKYDAQPLQPPPIPQPRNMNSNYQQFNGDYEQETPQYDNDNEDNYNQNNEEDDDIKRQQVWNKLRKANKEVKEKHSGVKKAPSGIANSSSNKNFNSYNNNTTNSSKKPPKPESTIKKPENNYLEKNIEAIKNKENLTHRYPEKKYEVVHGKNLSQRIKNVDSSKKPPHHLQPLENQNQEENDEDDLANKKIIVNLTNPNDTSDQAQKISIPIEASTLKNALKERDHINLDINLRLIDFMPNGNNQRSVDDFDVNPNFNRYNKNTYETNISRSLPGSSGSLNKLKPLPPLNSKRNGFNNINHFHKAHSTGYDNYETYEDGYLAQLQKSNVKPIIKTYTIKDYRNFKKDALPLSTNSTGKLGFDYESDSYRNKVEIAQRKGDYAERVKARNRILLAEQKRNEDADSKANTEPSKLQRAKEYVKSVGLLRQNSAPKYEDDSISQLSNNKQNQQKQQLAPIQQKQIATKQQPQAIRNQQNRSQPLDLTNREEKPPHDTTIVRIRDPITSKVKKIYLNDKDIELLSHRHEEEKNKVNKIFNEDANINKKPNLSKIPSETKMYENVNINNNRKPIDFGKENEDNNNFNSFKQTIENYEIAVDKRNNENKISINKKSNVNDNNDNDFDKLLERHNQEKKLVNEFVNY